MKQQNDPTPPPSPRRARRAPVVAKSDEVPAGSEKKKAAPRARRQAPKPLNEDAIRRRAYELFQQRGGAHGGAMDDWLQAERELAGPKRRAVAREHQPLAPSSYDGRH